MSDPRLLLVLSFLFACSSAAPQPVPAAPDAGTDAATGVEAGPDVVEAAAPTPFTLTITAPQPNAPVSGTIALVGEAPGFVNVEVHSGAGVLLSRAIPDAAGHVSASVDTTRVGNGAAAFLVDAWDAPAGSPFTHHANATLALAVQNAESCLDTQGNGIRYFGAYTKNTQTNYDFDAWAGFHQDFLTSFMTCDTWAHAASSDWGFDIMSLQPPGENIQGIVCLTTSEDPSLKNVAAGTYDSYFQQMGNLFIKHGYPNAFVRVGHEFEGNWYPWGLLGGANDHDYAGFIAAFRHVVAILKSISPAFTIVWNPGCGAYAQAMDSEKAYPGDDVVDAIGVDCYDDGSGAQNIIQGVYGMNQWGQFAQQHGKPIAVPEWGLMNGGDDPAYIQAMFDFMKSHPTLLESFWDSDDGSTHSQITTGEAPNSGATFLQTFSAYAKACHP